MAIGELKSLTVIAFASLYFASLCLETTSGRAAASRGNRHEYRVETSG